MKVLLNGYDRRVVEDILDLASVRLGLSPNDVKVSSVDLPVDNINMKCCIEMTMVNLESLKEILEKVKRHNSLLTYSIKQ